MISFECLSGLTSDKTTLVKRIVTNILCKPKVARCFTNIYKIMPRTEVFWIALNEFATVFRCSLYYNFGCILFNEPLLCLVTRLTKTGTRYPPLAIHLPERYRLFGIGIPQDDVIKWKHFQRYWPFVRGIHRSPVNSPHKGQWRGVLMFVLI